VHASSNRDPRQVGLVLGRSAESDLKAALAGEEGGLHNGAGRHRDGRREEFTSIRVRASVKACFVVVGAAVVIARALGAAVACERPSLVAREADSLGGQSRRPAATHAARRGTALHGDLANGHGAHRRRCLEGDSHVAQGHGDAVGDAGGDTLVGAGTRFCEHSHLGCREEDVVGSAAEVRDVPDEDFRAAEQRQTNTAEVVELSLVHSSAFGTARGDGSRGAEVVEIVGLGQKKLVEDAGLLEVGAAVADLGAGVIAGAGVGRLNVGLGAGVAVAAPILEDAARGEAAVCGDLANSNGAAGGGDLQWSGKVCEYVTLHEEGHKHHEPDCACTKGTLSWCQNSM
jgi:hypothetical protein